MKNSFDEKILNEAKDWLAVKRNVVLATVIQTWGSSPRPIGSRMIVNDKGDFSGSVSNIPLKNLSAGIFLLLVCIVAFKAKQAEG